MGSPKRPVSLMSVDYSIDIPSDGVNRRIKPRRSIAFPLLSALIVLCFSLTFVLRARLDRLEPKETLTRETVPDAIDYPPFRERTDNAPVCSAISSSSIDYTLMTQMSDDRLWMMKHHCKRWGPHPISIAVFSNETRSQITDRLEEWNCTQSSLSVEVIDSSLYSAEDYPVNALRNLALANVRTSHVVILDIDFWPSEDMYDTLMQPHVKDRMADDPKAAFVIPSFQLEPRVCRSGHKMCYVDKMPKTRDEVVMYHNAYMARQFDPTNKGGQGSTPYDFWLEEDGDEVTSVECISSNRYEPVLAIRYCRDLPPFQEAFTGYGKNRLSWFMHVRRAGWVLWESSKAFVIHFPHPESTARMAWNGGKDGSMIRREEVDEGDLQKLKRFRIDRIFVEYRKWLESTIPDATRLPKCANSHDDDQRLWVESKRLR